MQAMAVVVDLIHAAALVAWIGGLPLLFWYRWPRLTRWYAIYALVFVALTQISYHLLGECFLTTIARFFFEQGDEPLSPDIGDWFTVRLAKWVFGFAPSRRSIVYVWEAGVVLTAVGALIALSADRHQERYR